jgi:hypothetical protein
MLRRLPLASLLALHLAAGSLAGQTMPVRAPDGVLTGVVHDSALGGPVGYALVILLESNQRVFASEAGRFTLSGVGSGRVTLRVQQIGFRAVTLALDVNAAPGTPPGSPALVVRLARQAFVLPEIVVQGDVCTGVEALGSSDLGGIIDEAFKNAERLLSLQQAYPYRGAFQRVTMTLNAAYERTGGWVDTVRYDSRTVVSYRQGKVLETGARRSGREYANYFTTADIAREEFRKSHCFWYAGRDSLDGFPGYRVDFAPTKRIRSPDWAGSLLIDSATMRLLRSEAHLVNLPKRGTTFGSALCTVLYQETVPTLVQEFQARCVIAQLSRPPSFVVERWLLIDHSFIGRRPDGVDPP